MGRKGRILKQWSVAILFIIALFSSSSFAKYSGGTGEPNTPYQIANVTDLMTLANDANDYNKYFIMTDDIDLDPNLPGNRVFTTAVIAPDINSSLSGFQGTKFTGSFDGNGYKIMNLRIDTAGASNYYLGLFGYINNSAAQVKNLGIVNAIIIGSSNSSNLGGLCGNNEYGTIKNCYATSSVTGYEDLGGLCGLNNDGKIYNCYVTSSVTGNHNLGGLCGSNYWWSTISDSYASGSVSGHDNLGGLCGYNSYSTINKCYATGQVNGESFDCGGLCGSNSYSTINKCYATGQVIGGYYSMYCGGLCGSNEKGQIQNCYATGSVSGGSYIGGLCGINGNISSDFVIKQCYASGYIYGKSNKGGFCGYNNGTVTGCFWDINASGISTSSGGTGLTTSQMKQQASFVGWDFVWETANGPNDIWAICQGVSYPKLAWQYMVGDSDSDKDVDFSDFAAFAGKWMQNDSTLYCGGSDLTGDGIIDIRDLAAFAENWLQKD